MLEHKSVADRGSDQRDAVVSQRALEADIAHHRRNDRVAGQLAARVHRTPDGEQHVVAANGCARLVDEERAVRVAVKSDAHGAAVAARVMAAHGGLQLPQVGRAALDVDSRAVIFAVELDDVGAELTQHVGRDRVGRPKAGIDDNLQPVQIRLAGVKFVIIVPR